MLATHIEFAVHNVTTIEAAREDNSWDQQTLTTTTVTSYCSLNIVMLNWFQCRFWTNLWLQLPLQSAGPMNHCGSIPVSVNKNTPFYGSLLTCDSGAEAQLLSRARIVTARVGDSLSRPRGTTGHVRWLYVCMRIGNFTSQDFDMFLRICCGSFANNSGDLQRTAILPLWNYQNMLRRFAETTNPHKNWADK